MNNGGPAFPYEHSSECFVFENSTSRGMTLRDYFAAQALAGLLASLAHPDVDRQGGIDFSVTANRCYEVADAMLAQRQKE